MTGRCAPTGHCVTCADEAVPMRVVGPGEAGTAICQDEDGARAEVMIDLVEPVAIGEILLVHAGVALTRGEAVR